MKIRVDDSLDHMKELAMKAIRENASSISYEEDHDVSDKGVLSMKWSTGGMSGGSCWGDEATPYSNDYTPKCFLSLDKLIEMLCPNISFLVYKELERELVNEDSTTDYEWYGNLNNYAVKTVDLKDLLMFLLEKELVTYE